MKTEYPLFPELSEEGNKEAIKFIESFKAKLAKSANDIIETTMSEVYCDIMPHIESDSWMNFRNDLMDGFKNYNNRKIQGDYNFALIRKQIFKDFHDEIIKDLDKDNIAEIKKLNKRIEELESENRRLINRF